MKQKKIFKSLADLSADSIGAKHAEPEKTKPPEPHTLAEATPKIPPESVRRGDDVRGGHHWGINE